MYASDHTLPAEPASIDRIGVCPSRACASSAGIRDIICLFFALSDVAVFCCGMHLVGVEGTLFLELISLDVGVGVSP